jgi:hypothetical protein
MSTRELIVIPPNPGESFSGSGSYPAPKTRVVAWSVLAAYPMVS